MKIYSIISPRACILILNDINMLRVLVLRRRVAFAVCDYPRLDIVQDNRSPCRVRARARINTCLTFS